MSAVEAAKQEILHEGSLARQGTIRSKYGSLRGAPTPGQTPPAAAAAAAPIRRRSSEEAAAAEDVEWLRELPDEMEVCIAQREFPTCLELLAEGRDYLADCPEEAVAKEVAAKLTLKERQLVQVHPLPSSSRSSSPLHLAATQVLARELRAAGDRSGPKAARKAIQLLIKLGKSSYVRPLRFWRNPMRKRIRLRLVISTSKSDAERCTRPRASCA